MGAVMVGSDRGYLQRWRNPPPCYPLPPLTTALPAAPVALSAAPAAQANRRRPAAAAAREPTDLLIDTVVCQRAHKTSFYIHWDYCVFIAESSGTTSNLLAI